jgi:lipopolysaccharide/colanic/teichoic acid biosynthesis glycosyltransferase
MAYSTMRPLPVAVPGRSRLPQEARPWYVRGHEPFLDPASYEMVKRAMDILASALALPFVLLLLGLLAAAVRLDSPGAPFFSQPRTGRGGKRFRMYKLRTMVRNAEELKKDYMHLNELQYPDFKIANDPRITRVGRFLRKTSLDELPQVLNVLRGDMTLIGPRPTSFSSDTYRLWHTARLQLQPGMTGLWQVSGRNELGFDDRVRLDVAYIRNRCLWLDIQLLLRTGLCVFTGRGAN